MGIEPTLRAWEAPVLPLNYTRLDILKRDIALGCFDLGNDVVFGGVRQGGWCAINRQGRARALHTCLRLPLRSVAGLSCVWALGWVLAIRSLPSRVPARG